MRIRMLTSISGAWTADAGDEVDRPDAEARRLIAAGFARWMKQPSATGNKKATLPQNNETATLPETETK